MKEGFYSIAFAGATGAGFGIIVLDTDLVVGVDATGVKYDGTYAFSPRSGKLEAHLKLTVPAGVALVSGAPAQPQEWSFEIDAAFPREASDEIVSVMTKFGPVDVVINFLRGFPG